MWKRSKHRCGRCRSSWSRRPEGSKSAEAALSALGLSANDLGRLSPDAQFRLIAERLSQIRNPALRAALAMEVFGKSGTQLLPLMADGARGIRQLEAEARDLGLTMRAEDAEAATRLGDAFTALWKTVLSVARVVGSTLAPLLTEVALGAARIVITLRKWIEQNKTLVVTVFKVLAGVVAVGAGLIALGGVITGLGTVLGVVVTAFGAIGTAVGMVGQVLAALLSPIGLVVAAFAGLAAYIVYASGLGSAALDASGPELRGPQGRCIGRVARDCRCVGCGRHRAGRQDSVAHAQARMATRHQLSQWPLDPVQGLLRIDRERSRVRRCTHLQRRVGRNRSGLDRDHRVSG